MSTDTQFTTTVLMTILGVMSALGLIGFVGAIWSMGRQAYRKD